MLGVLNSYIVQKATAAKKLTHHIFRRELVKQLVLHFIPQAPAPPLRLPKGTANLCLFRLTAGHLPKLIEHKAGTKRKKSST